MLHIEENTNIDNNELLQVLVCDPKFQFVNIILTDIVNDDFNNNEFILIIETLELALVDLTLTFDNQNVDLKIFELLFKNE